jgi:hypothetical protein
MNENSIRLFLVFRGGIHLLLPDALPTTWVCSKILQNSWQYEKYCFLTNAYSRTKRPANGRIAFIALSFLTGFTIIRDFDIFILRCVLHALVTLLTTEVLFPIWQSIAWTSTISNVIKMRSFVANKIISGCNKVACIIRAPCPPAASWICRKQLAVLALVKQFNCWPWQPYAGPIVTYGVDS